ncbi:MAG TPA: hypothetical protein VL282_00340 [Tepidisphaeraceae bacterium]|jgi:hypothetical protein|nr:hypothetical protein [Tepidisphaeraceae bacterium]
MRLTILIAIVVGFSLGAGPATSTAPAVVTLYDANPNHLWNRLHRVLLVRTALNGQDFGDDTIDPLLWTSTHHLLDDESHKKTIDVLDEFLATHGERLIADPLKRAVLQRDLWAVFDWAAQGGGYAEPDFESQRRALELRLAEIIRRIALSKDEIAALPDTYEAAVKSQRFPKAFDPDHPAPYLPADLFDAKGPWISLAKPGDGIVAPVHTRDFDARSIFEIFLRIPDGRKAGMDYLQSLNDVLPKILPANNSATTRDVPLKYTPEIMLNPKLPQFPVGTQLALVRRALLVDRNGELRPTHLIESVQLRYYREIADAEHRTDPKEQAFFEFRFSRRALLADPSGALNALTKDSKDFEFVKFDSMGIDPFEADKDRDARYTSSSMATCVGCHSQAGVNSFNSFTRRFGPVTFSPELTDASPDYQAKVTMIEKRERFDWGLLQGILHATTQPSR